MDVDQEIICFSSSVTDRNEAETYDVNKAEILLSVTGGSSLSKPRNDDSAVVHLIIESMQVMKRDETIEAVLGDQITIEDRPQAQLIEPEEKEEEPYEGDREITKCEEADQIAVENDYQEMQPSEYQDNLINGDQEKFISDKLSPESNSFLVYGVKVQEFSLPPSDGPFLSESRNLNEDNSAEAALHVEVHKPIEEDETAEEVLYDQIIVENNPLMQSSEKGQLENCNYCSGNVVAKGEEAVEIVHEDILQVFNNPKTQVREEEDEDDDDDDEDDDRVGGKNVDEAVEMVHFDVELDKNPQTQLSEEYDDVNNGGSENGKEVVETVQTDVFEVENKLRTLSSEDDEEGSDYEEEDEEESDGEEDDFGKVEESSETTGDSSLESNADAIWPAESVQELSLKLKELQANEQNLKETKGEDMTVNKKHNCQNGNDHNIKGEGKFVRASTQKFMAESAALKQPIKFLNLKIWILSLLVLLLPVLWLHVAK